MKLLDKPTTIAESVNAAFTHRDWYKRVVDDPSLGQFYGDADYQAHWYYIHLSAAYYLGHPDKPARLYSLKETIKGEEDACLSHEYWLVKLDQYPEYSQYVGDSQLQEHWLDVHGSAIVYLKRLLPALSWWQMIIEFLLGLLRGQKGITTEPASYSL